MHPSKPFGYAVNELDLTVMAFAHDPQTGELQEIQTLTFTGTSIAVPAPVSIVFARNGGGAIP